MHPPLSTFGSVSCIYSHINRSLISLIPTMQFLITCGVEGGGVEKPGRFYPVSDMFIRHTSILRYMCSIWKNKRKLHFPGPFPCNLRQAVIGWQPSCCLSSYRLWVNSHNSHNSQGRWVQRWSQMYYWYVVFIWMVQVYQTCWHLYTGRHTDLMAT